MDVRSARGTTSHSPKPKVLSAEISGILQRFLSGLMTDPNRTKGRKQNFPEGRFFGRVETGRRAAPQGDRLPVQNVQNVPGIETDVAGIPAQTAVWSGLGVGCPCLEFPGQNHCRAWVVGSLRSRDSPGGRHRPTPGRSPWSPPGHLVPGGHMQRKGQEAHKAASEEREAGGGVRGGRGKERDGRRGRNYFWC